MTPWEMSSQMSQNTTREMLLKMRERYRRRGREGRSRLIDEVCEMCGYKRKHAIKVLGGKLPVAGAEKASRGGPRHPRRGRPLGNAGEQPAGLLSGGYAQGAAQKIRGSPPRAALLGQPWKNVRDGVDVKLHADEGELYVFAQNRDRVAKERSMRLRQLRGLLRRLKELHAMKLLAKDLLLKLSEARERLRAAWRLLDFELPSLRGKKRTATFSFRLNREKLAMPAAVKAANCCEPTFATKIRPNFGTSTSGSPK